jgi:hypothetical protein
MAAFQGSIRTQAHGAARAIDDDAWLLCADAKERVEGLVAAVGELDTSYEGVVPDALTLEHLDIGDG